MTPPPDDAPAGDRETPERDLSDAGSSQRGARGLSESDLERAYKSRVDPRLNYEQALECAMRIARHLRGTK